MNLDQQSRFDLVRDLLSRGFPPSQVIEEVERLVAYVLQGKAEADASAKL